MIDSVENIKMNNKNFNYKLFDDEDCRNFIKNNFDGSVLYAFDSLKPGAYKADLWRYCVLYILGGIYIDIKYQVINNFKFENCLDKEYFVLDLDKKNVCKKEFFELTVKV
jgi:mannosyltransferase OCH1-like enzyme